MKAETLPSVFISHSPVNPGRRVLPVRICCIGACLRSRFLAINASSETISSSASLNAPAMARCSSQEGLGL